MQIFFLLGLGVLWASQPETPDVTDLIFPIDDKYRIMSLDVEHNWMKLLNDLEREYKELTNLVEVIDSASESLHYQAKDLCSVKSTATGATEELLINLKPEVTFMIEELCKLGKELDTIRETYELDVNEQEFVESLREGIMSDVDKLETSLSLNEGLDSFLNEKMKFMALSVYERLKGTFKFTHQQVESHQSHLESHLSGIPEVVAYETITELSNELYDYAQLYKQYFSNFSALIQLKQNFLGVVPGEAVDFLPSIEESYLQTLVEMNKDRRERMGLDEQLSIEKLHQADDLLLVKNEFWHYNYLQDDSKDHLLNRPHYESLFEPHPSSMQVGFLEGNIIAKAFVMDAVVVNPEGCPDEEVECGQVTKMGSISTMYSVGPDVSSHPEFIEQHTTNKVVLNLKGLRELRKTIFYQFQLTLTSDHRTIIVNDTGCKSEKSQVAHVYAEAVRIFSKQGIHAVYFADENLHDLITKFLKGF